MGADVNRAVGPGTIARLAACAVFALLLPRLDMPWGTDLASVNGGFYMLSEMRAFEAAGWSNLAGIPHLGSLPTEPPIGNPYVHHPPGWPALLFATTRLTGLDPWGLRLLPALAAAATAGLLTWWLLVRGAPIAVTLLVVLSRPILHLYGPMPNPESIVALLIVSGLLLDEKRREGRGWALPALLAVVAVAPWMDWQGAFLVPAIWLRSAVERRPWRRWKAEIAIAFVGTVSLLLLVTWLGHAVAHLDDVRRSLLGGNSNPDLSGSALVTGLRHMAHVATGSTHAGPALGIAAWWSTLGTHFATMIGSWVLVAGFFVFGRHGHDVGRLAALALPGVLNIALFRLHAANHDFWVIHLLPVATWMFIAAITGGSRDARVRVLLAAIVAVMGIVTLMRERGVRDASVSDVEARAVGIAGLTRSGIASAWVVPVATASRHLRGHVVDLPIGEVRRLVDFARQGVLTGPIDVLVPETTDVRTAIRALPGEVPVVPLPLDAARDPTGALATWAGTSTMLRVEIPRTMR